MHFQSPWNLRSFPSRVFMTPLMLAALLAAFSSGSLAMAQERAQTTDSWTDISGEKTVIAEFVKLQGVQLTLRKADGKEIVLPLSKLDDKSRIKARAMAKNGGISLSSSTDSSSASSSVKISAPVSFPSNPTPQEFIDIVVRELKNENLMVFWDALPASKQKQVQEVVKLASTRVEQRTLNLVKKFRSDLLTALRSKKQFILNSRAIPIPPGFGNAFDPLLGLIEDIVPNEWMDADYLQKAELRDLLSKWIGSVLARSKEIKKAGDGSFASMLDFTKIESQVKSVSANEAMISLIRPGFPTNPPKFLLSEGRWLPAELLANWDQAMGQVMAALEQANPKELHQMTGRQITAANLSLGAFSLVETQEDFDSVVGQLMQLVSGMAGGMAPPGAGGPGAFPGR